MCGGGDELSFRLKVVIQESYAFCKSMQTFKNHNIMNMQHRTLKSIHEKALFLAFALNFFVAWQIPQYFTTACLERR